MNIEGPELSSAAECEPVIRALPQWFKDEKSIQRYLADIDKLPTFKAYEADQLVGFITLKMHFPESAEILIFGVLPGQHGSGVGSQLLARAEAWLVKQGGRYLQLKTLSASVNDEHYAATRAFYVRRGFAPVEEFPTLWTEEYPCLLMMKYLADSDV